VKKLIVILLVALVMGGAGYVLGRYLFPPELPAPAVDPEGTEGKAVLYKLPLGSLTFQVLQPTRILHIVIDLDVFVSEAAVYEQLGNTGGRARLRDTTISAVSDLSETMLWVKKGEERMIDKRALAQQIVQKLHNSYPAVKSAQINQFLVSNKARQ